MKTIVSIIEVIMLNVLPPALAVSAVTMVKDIIPFLGIVLIRVGLYIEMGFQKLYSLMSQKAQQAKLFRLDNIVRIDHYKKIRA